ncbi:MAG: hypothetical protein R2865_04120 [Deinococcales bacterium]
MTLFKQFNSLLKLAWRNIGRQKRRTFLLIMVVAYATLATIFFWGFNEGFNDSILQGQARYLVAPAMVMKEAYFDDSNPEYALDDLSLLNDLAKYPEIKAIVPRLEFSALVRSPYASEGVLVRGVEGGLEPQVSNIPQKIATGRMLEGQGEVILGTDLAKRLDVRLDERLVIESSSDEGPQALGLNVVGFIRSGLAAVDGRMVMIDIQDARKLTQISSATGLALELDSPSQDFLSNLNLPTGVKAYGLLELLGPIALRIRAQQYPHLTYWSTLCLFRCPCRHQHLASQHHGTPQRI